MAMSWLCHGYVQVFGFGHFGYVLMPGPGHVARCGGLGPFFGRSLGTEAEAERCLGQIRFQHVQNSTKFFEIF